ncbi:hypothetical protein [Saccharopolyspora sp. 6V]|uniref:hypothetical protein n=1 Tax=Saccharopolyspora sp. 6V TaxID=2877239 RepID=UPI001CD3D9E0|nr:hypothetical protein [Saccharopolyspora sp. 6V]MCA1195113.1 hypothetical protein [Saccharopolyspora sp. 6V]
MHRQNIGAAVRHLDSDQPLTGAHRGALSELLLTLDRARHTGTIPVSVALTLDRVVPVLAEPPATTPAIPAATDLTDDERDARRGLGERVRTAAPNIRTAVPGQLGSSLAVALPIIGNLVADHPGPLGLLPYHLGRIAHELEQQPAEVTK